MDSKDLFQVLMAHMGPSSKSIEKELEQLMEELNMKKEDLDLEQIRQLMTVYLNEVLLLQDPPISDC